MILWIAAVFCMIINSIIKFPFYFTKLENCIPEDCLTTVNSKIHLSKFYAYVPDPLV